jgi:hypothetical protein
LLSDANSNADDADEDDIENDTEAPSVTSSFNS